MAKGAVQQDLNRKKAEINGLKAMDFPLSFIQNETLILHDIRIGDENGFFQIDVLLLNQRCNVILEVKNWYGTITFDENDQVIRINDKNEEEGFPSPILQAKLQKYRLRKWLNKNGFSTIPIMYFIVISFPSTIIKASSPSVIIPKEVIHSNQLIFKYKNMMNNFTQIQMSDNELHALSQNLIKSHTPRTENLFKKYSVDISELIKGVFCSQCDLPSMIKIHQKWVCHRCNYETIDAHLADINDYKLIINDIASNKELREFLGINCKHVMKRIIKKASFEPIGNGRNRKYKL